MLTAVIDYHLSNSQQQQQQQHHHQPNEGEEYNPLRPNDYEKLVAERRRREAEEREKQREEEKRKELEEREKRRKERHARRDAEEKEREKRRNDSSSDEEEDDRRKRRGGGGGGGSGGGAAIAPPVALTKTDPLPGEEKGEDGGKEKSEEPMDPEHMPGSKLFGGSGNVSVVASKIMAKYGFKDGQGLGKGSQGMSTALVVEKTSKRGGKIIHEKDLEYGDDSTSTPPPEPAFAPQPSTSITDLMRNPSKVVLLRNMVGPGEIWWDIGYHLQYHWGKNRNTFFDFLSLGLRLGIA